jgi:hypothetical protein
MTQKKTLFVYPFVSKKKRKHFDIQYVLCWLGGCMRFTSIHALLYGEKVKCRENLAME